MYLEFSILTALFFKDGVRKKYEPHKVVGYMIIFLPYFIPTLWFIPHNKVYWISIFMGHGKRVRKNNNANYCN